MGIKDEVTGFGPLLDSAGKCVRGVKWKGPVAHYHLNELEETIRLSDQLGDGSYKPRKTNTFEVLSPKRRVIVSVAFRDRVYQRSLNDNSVYPQMSMSYIRDSFACQEDKGTVSARMRLEEFLRSYFRRNGSNGGFFAYVDVHGYYDHLRHSYAERCLRHGMDPWSASMAIDVLQRQYPGDTGYNPGSQMVQIVGLSALSPLDHLIKEKLREHYYLRYMDDLLIISDSRDKLQDDLTAITKHLQSIGLEPNPKKTGIRPISSGILFLGFVFDLSETGKVYERIDPVKVKQERRKLRKQVALYREGEMSKAKIVEGYVSWRSHCLYGQRTKNKRRKKIIGDNVKMIMRMDQFLKELLKEAGGG